jgi:ribose-phosphate pyrophosphokinase
VPYFGYGRADKRHGRQEPLMARVVADLMQAVDIGWIITVDMHAPQIEGFFHVPVDNLTAVPALCGALRHQIPADVVVVAPDVGRIEMAIRYAEQCLGAPVAVVHKQRVNGCETKVARIVGAVAGRACLIIDDMISSGGTIAETIEALLASGVRPEIIVAATHGLFVGRAREKLSHPAIRAIFVTDTVSATEAVWPQLRVISTASLIAASIRQFLSVSQNHPERVAQATVA